MTLGAWFELTPSSASRSAVGLAPAQGAVGSAISFSIYSEPWRRLLVLSRSFLVELRDSREDLEPLVRSAGLALGHRC